MGRSPGARALAAALLALALAAAAMAGAGTARAEPNGSGVTTSQFERSLLAELNDVRRAHGLVPLRPSHGLAAAADAHSRAMGRFGFFAHESRDGSRFSDRVRRYYEPLTPRWTVGENLLWALRGTGPEQMIGMWIQSPTHRQNILTPQWREVGLGVITVPSAPGFYRGLDVVIVTTDFGVR